MDFFGPGSEEIWNEQINEMFSKKKDSEINIILQVVSLLIYQNANSTLLVDLYKLLGPEKFSQMVLLLDGTLFKLPSASEFKESLVVALCFYYKEIKGFSWQEIKDKFPFEISGISCGIKIKQLNNFLQQKVKELFTKEDIK
jgi:hypothetical protein